MTELILTRVTNGIGFITLNRPKALNALNLEMVRAIHLALNEWARDAKVLAVVLYSNSPKALCAGGDIRFFHQAALAKDVAIDDFFTEEYALNHCIAHFSKPYIALMQGVVMGGGMGISAVTNPATGLRVVCDSSKLAMPEVKIGLFPDVGGTYFLSHLPQDPSGALGRYLALTATTMQAADAIYAGLADAYCPAEQLTNLIDQLETTTLVDGASVRACVITFCQQFVADCQAQTSSLSVQRSAIEACFSGESVADILAAIERYSHHSPCAAEFTAQVNAALAHASPLMVHATLNALLLSECTDLASALRMERSLMRRCFAQGEPVEGIRALAVDKDHSPRWTHTYLTSVTDSELAALFEPEWDDTAHPLRGLV